MNDQPNAPHEHDDSDEHDEHGHAHGDEGHGGLAHGPEPLPGVRVDELHTVVDDLARTLHEYVTTAAGVRAEFGASEADEDPRVLALEARVSGLNAALYDLVHERLGLHADLTGMTWDGDEDEAEGHDRSAEDADTFHLGFLVSPPAGTSDLTMDSVLGIVDDGGTEIARRLIESGFEVAEWGASRGAPVGFEDEDDDEDDQP